MEVIIPSPRHYENMYGSSHFVRAYLDQIEKKVGEVFTPAIDILRISLLIAHPDELAQGYFLEYEKFDWRSKFAAVGVNGNFDRYHLGDDLEKICEISEMLQTAFIRISQKKKAKFDCKLANEIVIQTTYSFAENFSKK